MNVLISGGSGFLGRALTAALIQDPKQFEPHYQDITVTWLSRSSQQGHPKNVNVITYEALANLTADDLSNNPFDVIINLAGSGIADSRWSDERKEALLASRVKPTEAILEVIAKAPIKPKLLLSGSAVGWYGVQGDTAIDESSDARADFAHKLCEDWELLATKAAEFGVPVAILRTGVVIHVEGGMVKRLLTPFKLGLGGKLGDGSQFMSWISREDWVRAALFIIEQSLSGSNQNTDQQNTHAQNIRSGDNETTALVYNLTAPNPVTNLQFTQALGHFLHRPTVMSVPAPMLKAMFGEMSTLLLDGQKVLPKALLDSGFTFHQPNLDQALSVKADNYE